MKTVHPLVEKMTINDKLEMIRTGKRRRSLTGFKENKKIKVENTGGQFVVVEKEKRFEESGVTRKKRNYIEFESKLGTERERDLTKISGPARKAQIQPRNEERIIQKKKKLEYLDNYQYKETKQFGKNPRPAVVIHNRLGNIIGGTIEEYTFQRYSANTRPMNTLQKPAQSIRTYTKKQSNESNVKAGAKIPKPTTVTATKTVTTTTKVGRRGGAGGATSTTTKTTNKSTTTRTTRRGVK